MKKIWIGVVSLTLSAFMLLTGCLTAFAEQPKTNWEPRPNAQDAEAYVNGYGDLISVYEEWDRESDASTFWTDGFRHVTGWEFPLLTENVDYKVISESSNKITIRQIADDPNTPFYIPYINVLVNNLEEGKKILEERSAQIDAGDQQAEEQKTAKQSVQQNENRQKVEPAENERTENTSTGSSSPSETATAATKSTVQSISSQVTETADSPRIPVIPIITAAAVAAIAGALGIFLYKKRKSRFTD